MQATCGHEAGEALVRAGRRAASLGASEEADRAFVQAADLIDDPSVRAELLAEAGDAASGGARWQAASERYEQSIALLEAAGAPTRAARVTGQLGWSMWYSGDLAGGADRIEHALKVLADEEPDADLATLTEIYARLRYFLGDIDTAAERVERALEIAESLVVHDVLVDALNTKHLVLVDARQAGRGAGAGRAGDGDRTRARPDPSLLARALQPLLPVRCSRSPPRRYRDRP